VELAVLLKIPL